MGLFYFLKIIESKENRFRFNEIEVAAGAWNGWIKFYVEREIMNSNI